MPLATCGTALTDAHLDLLARHAPLDRVILAFDADPAGRKATLTAGSKLVDRSVAASDIELFTAPAGADPAAILADDGSDRLAAHLADPRHHGTLLDLLVDQKLDRYDTDNQPLRDLPISEHVAYEAARLVADTFRNQITDPAAVTAHIQRHISRFIARTDIDAGQLNRYLLDMLIRHDDLEFELPDLHEHESHNVEHEDEVAATPDHDPGIGLTHCTGRTGRPRSGDPVEPSCSPARDGNDLPLLGHALRRAPGPRSFDRGNVLLITATSRPATSRHGATRNDRIPRYIRDSKPRDRCRQNLIRTPNDR